MAKYKCSSDKKVIWEMPPKEASKQVFASEDDAREWFEGEFPGQKIEISKYTATADHDISLVKADGKTIGRIDLY